MPILARRSIQKLVDEIAVNIDRDLVDYLLGKLNRENVQSLDALWEIIVITILSRHGCVVYEKGHGGSTQPDIFFSDNKGVELVADVTCISDLDQIKNNDINYFNSQLSEAANKLGIDDLSGFDIRVESYKDSKNRVTLKLPPKNKARNYIDNNLKEFLCDISNNKGQYKSLNINEDNVELSIRYNPSSKYLSFGHSMFTVANSIHYNPLYNRLRSKSKQLKKSGFNGLKGIFLCDGGLDLLSSEMDNLNGYGAGEIINRFLSSQNTISFVIVIYIDEKRTDSLTFKMEKSFRIKYASKENCNAEISNLVRNIETSVIDLPEPIATAKNATASLKGGFSYPGNSFYGGYALSGNSVEISSRALLDLINGSITSDDFIKDHDHAGNFLANKIEEGYRLKSIVLNKVDDSDDDWVEFCFDDIADPAISKYTNKA